MLTKLELKNFRVFEESNFELKPLTILVGENGTGKSTALYALCFLAQSLNQVNYRDFIDLRSFDETVRKGAESFEIGIEFEEERNRVALQEVFKEGEVKSANISTDGKTLLKTEKEWLIEEIIKKQEEYPTNKAQIEESINRGGSKFTGGGVLNFSISGGAWTLVEIRRDAEVGGLARSVGDLHKDLTSTLNILHSVFKRIVPILAGRSIFEDAFTVGGRKPDINEVVKKSTALGNILTWLKRAEEHDKIKELNDAFKQLDCRLLEKPEEEALGQGVIFMEDLSLKTTTRGSLTSYGYNKVAQLLASLVLSPKGSILCIEDPEIHLHPRAQAALMDLIIKSMKEGKRQAIITTHSEHMLIRLVRRIADGTISPEEVAVYYLSKEEGKIEAEKIEVKEKGFVSESFWKFFEEEMRDVFEIKFRGG
ncbi:MAG: DUF3696 domain-containing protein [archaeon]|nr:DUF3696 domain-containing protein [archaeon]